MEPTGKTEFKAIVRGRLGACHAFVGAIESKCSDISVVSERPCDRGHELLLSGLMDTGAFPLGTLLSKDFPPVSGLPDDPDGARAFGESRYGRIIISIQQLSYELNLEVLFAKSEKAVPGRADSYVHYDCGEQQADSWTKRHPRELDFPKAKRRWFRR